jgi:hypothetical protein
MMLVQADDQRAACIHVRVIDELARPDPRPWFKGEVIPLWGMDTPEGAFDQKVKSFAIGHLAASAGYSNRVTVAYMERRDLLDAPFFVNRERYQLFTLEEEDPLQINRPAVAGTHYGVKNWARLPCHGMRSGHISLSSNVGQPYCISIAQQSATVDGNAVGSHNHRVPVIPLFVMPAPTPVDADTFALNRCIPFTLDPNCYELTIRVWRYLDAVASVAPTALVSLSGKSLESHQSAHHSSGHWITAVGTVDTDQHVCSMINSHRHKMPSAAFRGMNWHAANAVTYRLMYHSNIGLDTSRDQHVSTTIAAVGIAANTQFAGIGAAGAWDCVTLGFSSVGPIAQDAAVRIAEHRP